MPVGPPGFRASVVRIVDFRKVNMSSLATGSCGSLFESVPPSSRATPSLC